MALNHIINFMKFESNKAHQENLIFTFEEISHILESSISPKSTKYIILGFVHLRILKSRSENGASVYKLIRQF